MRRIACLAAAAALSIAGSAVPAEKGAAMNFDWLAGHWCQDKGGKRIEELWWPARADFLMGMSRATEGDNIEGFEYLRIVIEPDAATLLAQPEGGHAVRFKRTAGGPAWARFENPQHDFPTRIEYRRSNNRLHAEVAGPGEGGKESVIPFDYTACR